MDKCRKCSSALMVGENWRASLAKAKSRICTPCRRIDEVKYLNSSPERREKMRQTAAKWRQQKQ